MMITVEQPPAPEIASREEVKAVEVADRDDHLQGDDVGVVQLRQDVRPPLQVLGDIDVGVLDLVKCHHIQSARPRALPKGLLPRVVGVSL